MSLLHPNIKYTCETFLFFLSVSSCHFHILPLSVQKNLLKLSNTSNSATNKSYDSIFPFLSWFVQMPIEDEIKPKEESKEDLKPHIKKAENVPLGPAKIRKQYTYVSICFMYTIDKK